MKKSLIFLMVVAALFIFSQSSYALSITTSSNGTDLVNAILGSGITVSNITYNGHANASGMFSDGLASGLGIDEGILLTSGWASDADGPNQNGGVAETLGGGGTGDDTSKNLGIGGDADLTALAGYNTFDATILEFDFITTGGDLFFNFVFGSEEYIDYVGTSYNDVFGFFLDGVNLAVLPGTSTPVTINTINPVTNSAYYMDNINPAPYDVEYDGFTTVLEASMTGMDPGSMHHIKLAIADTSDHILDSGVFIEAGSFSDVPTDPIPEPATLFLMGLGMLSVGIGSRKRKR